jgi:LPXTG-site transpeptidase (sortase) family protein
MTSFLFAFLAGLAFTLWLARRPPPELMRFGSPRPAARDHWLLLVSALAVVGAMMMTVRPWMPAPVAAPAPARAESTRASAPHALARLLIPELGVDAPITTVPLAEGQWDISRLDAEVGWLERTGERPGADLAMAFIGHVTLSAVERGPFADLWTLKPTAQLIYRAGGMDYLYAILDVFNVKPQDVDRLFVPDGQRLLLVTCANWNYLTETYNARLVAEAVLVKTQLSP